MEENQFVIININIPPKYEKLFREKFKLENDHLINKRS